MRMEDYKLSFEGIKGLTLISAIFDFSVVFGIGAFKNIGEGHRYSQWDITNKEILNYMNIYVNGIENALK